MPSKRANDFRKHVLGTYDLSPPELILLDEVCRVITTIDEIVAKPKYSKVEVRQQQTTLGRLLGQLHLPDADGADLTPSPATLRGRRAAQARWDRVRNERAAGGS
jgi:hypothetical protein